MVFQDKTLAPYHGSEPYIFLSYSHRNSDRAASVISRLNRSGFRVWYDEGLIPGREWDENIARIIMGCSYFIALLTEEYLASSNCRDELNFARDKNKPLLLIYLDEVNLPAGMELRLGRLFAVHRAQYSSEEAFYAKVFSADGLARCNRRYVPGSAPAASSAPRSAQPSRQRAAARELTEDDAPVSSGSSGSALPVVGAILILLLLAAAAWYLYSSWASAPEAPLPTPVQTVEPASPTVSNEAELDIEVTPTPASSPTPTVDPDAGAVPTEESIPTPVTIVTPDPTLPPTLPPTPPPTLPPEETQVVEIPDYGVPDDMNGSDPSSEFDNTVIIDPAGDSGILLPNSTDQDTTLS